jgi:choline monooxygenase
MANYKIHPDIRQAETLPGSFYHDADAFGNLKTNVFARSWQWIGVEQAVPAPQNAFPFSLLPGLLDEPLVLTRDATGRVRCLSNVCTHRGNILVRKGGACSALRCRYHGRRFALDGTMEHTPGFDDACDFPSPTDHLPQLELGRLGQFLFTSIRPACSFENWLEGLSERVGWLPLDQFRLDSTRTKTYKFVSNWALYVDNYLEGFHIPFVHADLNAALDIGGYETVLFPWGNVQIALAKEGESAFDLPETSPDFGKQVAAYYFWFFPNLMLNFYPWGLSINIVRPQSVNKTEVSFLTYVHDPHLLDLGASANLHKVELEDEGIVLQVQKGTAARLYDRGRYSPEWEKGVHQFHRMLVVTGTTYQGVPQGK